MSQHQIQVNSPKAGQVLVTVGYDPVLDEAFFNYFNDDTSYMSPPGLVVREIGNLAIEKLGQPLPSKSSTACRPTWPTCGPERRTSAGASRSTKPTAASRRQ